MARERYGEFGAATALDKPVPVAASPLRGQSSRSCAVCGKERVSIYSFRGVAQDGGGHVCFDCWARGHRSPANDETNRSAVAPVGPASSEPARTAAINRKPTIGGRTSRCERCDGPLPRSVRKRSHGPHYCIACQEALAGQLDTAPSGAVSAAEARELESAFLQHIDDGVNRIAAWPGEKALPKRRVKKDAQHSLPPLPENYLESHPLQDALRKRLDETPTRAYQQWNVRFGSRWPWRRDRQDLSVVAATWVPMRKALEQAYVSEPAGKHALMDLEALRTNAGNTPSLLLAFSPTGWDPNVTPPANTVLVSRDTDGQWTARKGAMAFGMRTIARQVVTPPMEHSEVERCAARIEHLSPSRFPVSARQMAREEGIAFDTVVEGMRAFAKANPSHLVCEDELRDDFLLEMRG